MSIKPSGIWCDLCRKPMFGNDEYWHCSINGKEGHACKACKDNYEATREKIKGKRDPK